MQFLDALLYTLALFHPDTNPPTGDVRALLMQPGRPWRLEKRDAAAYALQGYSADRKRWSEEIRTPDVIAGAFAQRAQEVMVCCLTLQTCPKTGHVIQFTWHYRTITKCVEPQ